MIEYSNIKVARKELANLQELFRCLQSRQEHLRSHIRTNGNGDRDVRMEICDNRLMMGKLMKRIRGINKSILKLDRESTQRDVERQIKESLARQLKEE